MKKAVVLGLLAILGFGGVMAQPVMAEGLSDSALCQDITDPALREAAGCETTKRADDFANAIINIVLGLVGIIAVGVMIYGGVTYLTSDGNAQKIEKAKHAIMYGLIGLVVCLLAYAIVIFVGRVIPS